MRIVLIIPARYKSKRLPGKPLVMIKGKTMIRRVYDQCAKAFPKEDIYVATEDERIVTHCEDYGIQTLLTTDTCLTGTDRVAESAMQIDADYYINVQGDEPIFNPDDIGKILEYIERYKGEIINGYCKIESENLYLSRTIPKVVFRPDGRMLFMSRSPIPGNKEGTFEKSWRQVCIYAFPKKSLLEFYAIKNKTTLEEIEDIEILRFLEMGYEVRMVALSNDSIAVDVPEDILRVEKKLENE